MTVYIYIHEHNSLPAMHADDNGHNFDWSQTRCLGQATTKYAREFKEAWHSIDELTFNRRIDIPDSCNILTTKTLTQKSCFAFINL
jgi:hypothetical protein